MFIESADMFAFKSRAITMIALPCILFVLQACSQPSEEAKKVEIKPAQQLTNDATTYANKAWILMNQIDGLVYAQKLDVIEDQVRKPVRKLTTDWRINVKMTESVTEGKYALCRKALSSLDVWARESLEQSATLQQKQADYERDKQQCKEAISHPELGNTDPKKKGI